MAKWEDLPVPVDEDVEREKAEVRANYEIWGKRVRTQVLGRLLLGMSGLFALHGYISFCIATDPVIAWGPEWMASDQFLGFCAILLPIGLIVALAALIGIWKNARMEHNKALYFSGLALTIIGTFAPFVSGLWLHTDWIFKLSFTTAPEFVGIMLVVAAFMREIGSDAESKRLAWLMALLYGLAATASIAVGGRAIAVVVRCVRNVPALPRSERTGNAVAVDGDSPRRALGHNRSDRRRCVHAGDHWRPGREPAYLVQPGDYQRSTFG